MLQNSQFTSMMAFGNNLDLEDNTITFEILALGCDTASLGI